MFHMEYIKKFNKIDQNLFSLTATSASSFSSVQEKKITLYVKVLIK